jgi:putative ABC transport system permease protein
VRLAVGASPNDIGRLVLGDGVTLVGVGLATGLVIVLLSAPVVESLLFGVSARNPLTLAVVALLIGGVALVACAVPAWRSAGTDPAITLRSE